MGDKGTIALLTSINGSLKSILELMVPQNPEDKDKANVSRINKGGLASDNLNIDSISKTDISVKEITSFLDNLSLSVRSIAALDKKGTIDDFKKVLSVVNTSLLEFASNESKLKSGTESLINISESFSKLQKTDFFSILVSFAIADKLNAGEKLGKVLTSIIDNINSTNNIDKEKIKIINELSNTLDLISKPITKMSLLAPLLPVFLASSVLLAPALKVLGKTVSQISKADNLENTAKVLEQLNSFIVRTAVLVGSVIAVGLAIKSVGVETIMMATGTVLLITGGLMLIATAISKLSSKTEENISNFESINKFVLSTVVLSASVALLGWFVKDQRDIIWNGLLLVGTVMGSLALLAVAVGFAGQLAGDSYKSINSISTFLTKMLLLSAGVIALGYVAQQGGLESAMAGTGMVLGIIGAFSLLAAGVGLLSKIINPVGMDAVVKMAAWGVALTLGTMLLGAVCMQEGAQEAIITGLGTVTAIITAFGVLAVVSGVLGTVLKATDPLRRAVVSFAAWGMGLTLGCILLGAVIEQSGDMVWSGLLTVSAILASFTLLTIVASKLGGKYLVAENAGVFLNIIKFAGWSLLVTAGCIALGAMIKKVGVDYTLYGIASLGLVISGLTGLSIAAGKFNITEQSTKGIIGLTKMIPFIGMATGVTVAAASLGILALKYGGWKGIISGVGMFSLVLGEIVAISKLASVIGESKTLDKGVASLLRVSYFMGVCSAVTLAIAGTAAVANKVGYDNILKTFGFYNLIVLEAVGLSLLSTKSNPVISAGSKSIASVMLLMGSATLVLGGIVGVAAGIKALTGNSAESWLYIGGVFAGMTMIVLAASELANLARMNSENISSGAKSLLLANGVMTSSILVVAGIVGVAALVNTLPGRWFEAIGVMTMMGAITGAAFVLSSLADKYEPTFKSGAKALITANMVMASSLLVVGGIVTVAAMVNKLPGGFKDLTGVILMMTSVTFAAAGLAKFADANHDNFIKGSLAIKQANKIMLSSLLVVGGIVAVATLMNVLPGKGGDVLGVVTMMGLVLYGTVKLVDVANKHANDMNRGIKNLFIANSIIITSGLVVAGIVALASEASKVGWSNVFATMGAMSSVILMTVTLATIANKYSDEISKSIKPLATTVLLAAGCAVLLYGITQVAKEGKEIGWEHISLTIGAMSTIILGFGAISAIISKIDSSIKKGLVGVAVIGLLAAGSIMLLDYTADVAAKGKEIGWDNIFISLGAMASIVGAFGLLGAAASFATPFILGGTPGVLASIVMATAAAGMLHVVIKVAEEAKNVEWKNVFMTVGAMASIVTGFGLLGTAASVAAPFMLVGSAGLVAAATVAGLSSIVLGKVINVTKEADGLEWNNVFDTVDAMTKTITKIGLLCAAASLATPFLVIGAAAITPAIAVTSIASSMMSRLITLVKTREGVSKESILENVSVMKDVISEIAIFSSKAAFFAPLIIAGSAAIWTTIKTLDTILVAQTKLMKINQDLKSSGISSNDLGKSLRSLLDVMSYDNIKLNISIIDGLKLHAQYASLSGTLDGLKSAVDLIGDFVSSIGNVEANGKIRPIIGHENGKPIYGQPVDIIAVSKTITGSIFEFSKVLESGFSKIKNSKEIKESFEVLGVIMQPISSFASTMVMFQSAGAGMIREIKFDKDGKLVDTPYVNISDSANSIADALTSFCSILFSKDNEEIWKNMVAGGTDIKNWRGQVVSRTESNPQIAMGILGNILEPVSNFAKVLAMFEDGGEGTLIIPEYDSNGNRKGGREVKVVSVAQKIASSISSFVAELFSESNIANWSKLVAGGTTVDTSGIFQKAKYEYQAGDTEKALGVFATIIDPISNFASMVAMFGNGSSADTLLVFDKDGNAREVNLKNISSNIANAISSFVNNIGSVFSDDNVNLKNLSGNSDKVTSILVAFSKNIDAVSKVDANKFSSVDEAFTKFLNHVIISSTPDTLAKMNSFGAMLNTFLAPFTIFNSPAIGNNVKAFDTNLIGLVNAVTKSSSKTNATNINNLADAIKRTSESLESFDLVLSEDSIKRRRLQDIKEFGEALEPVATNAKEISLALTEVKELLGIFENADSSKIENTIKALKSSGINFGGGGFSAGTSPVTIARAISEVLNSTQIMGANEITEIDFKHNTYEITKKPAVLKFKVNNSNYEIL